MEKELPTWKIEGTTFIVDVVKKEFREVANTENVMSILEMRDMGTHYEFDYDRTDKNLPPFITGEEDVIATQVPQLKDIDPEGMAAAYNTTVAALEGKSDFDIMVDQGVLAARLAGRLTTMDIEGHKFYVDIPMDCIRPHDDFSSHGIVFSDIEDYLLEDGDKFHIPYNKTTHQFQEIDLDTITAIPKDVVVIEIPWMQHLDPVGYARKYGFDQRELLRQTPIQANFTAKRIEWSETHVEKFIKRNLQRQKEQQQKPEPKKEKPKKGRRKGM